MNLSCFSTQRLFLLPPPPFLPVFSSPWVSLSNQKGEGSLCFLVCWAVLATVAALPFHASASPGMHSWDPMLGATLVKLVGLHVGHSHHGNNAYRDVGLAVSTSPCKHQSCHCKQSSLCWVTSSTAVGILSRQELLSYVMGFELRSLGSHLGRTYSTKTYSRQLTWDFLEDENHVSLGPSTSSVCFLCMCVVFWFWTFGASRREKKYSCHANSFQENVSSPRNLFTE